MSIATRHTNVLKSSRTSEDVAQRAAYLDLIAGDRSGYLALDYGIGPRMDGGRLQHHRWRSVTYAWPGDRGQVLDDVADAVNSGRVDVYVCPLLRSTARRRQGEAQHGRVVWVDVDQPTEDAPSVLGGIGAALVSSGTLGHVHAYVQLAHSVEPGELERLNRALAVRVGGDAKWADNSVLRMPGTVSHKTSPPTPVVWQVPPCGDMLRWNPAALLDQLGGPIEDAARRPTRAEPTPTGEPLPSRLPSHLSRLLGEPPGSDRSRQVFAAVAAGLEWGLTDGQVVTLVAELPAGRARGQVGRDAALALTKLRPAHTHPGKPCDRARCPNRPRWMSPAATPRLRGGSRYGR